MKLVVKTEQAIEAGSQIVVMAPEIAEYEQPVVFVIAEVITPAMQKQAHERELLASLRKLIEECMWGADKKPMPDVVWASIAAGMYSLGIELITRDDRMNLEDEIARLINEGDLAG